MQQRTPEEYKAAYEHHRKAGNDAKAARVAQLYREHLAQQPKPKDGAFEGFGDAFKRGIDQPLENFGTTAKVLGAENLGQSLQDAVDAPPGQSASSQFMNADKDGSFAYRYLPKAAVEQAGQFVGSLISRAGGAAAGGAIAGPPGAVAGGLAGPMFFEAIQQLGPIALERAKNNGRTEPNAEDFIYAAGTSAGVGALNAIAPGASGKIKRMLLEGLTEGTQSVGEQTGSTINTQKGLEVDPRQALAEGIIGGSSAGLVDTSISTVTAATNLVRGSGKKKDGKMSDADTEAQASLAQRLSNIATANNYDLNDIDRTSTTGARETVDAAHVQYTEDLMQLFKDLKDRVKVTDADSLSVVQNKILARAAYREGKNKTKNKVGVQEMAALEKLAGDTYEGQQAMSLLRQLNQLTEIHNDGYKGGASRLTDQFAPFGLGGEGYDSSRANAEQVLRPLITGGLASATGGASLIPQAAVYGTGRMIDKITGNRSKVNSFVSDNVGNEGIKVGSHPNPESLRERRREEAQAAQEAELAAQAAAEQRAAEKRESNLKSVRNNDPANPGSPQGIVELGTALDRNGVAQVLRIMKGNPNTTAYERKMIQDYETSVATGGYIDYDIVRKINGIVDNNPQLKPLMGNRVRNQGAVNQAAQQQLSQKDANYQRGIENNKAFAQQLQDALSQDSSVLPIHKAHLGEALNQMQLDLGAAPVKRLKAIEDRLAEKGVPTEAAAKYFAPYVERVVAQQEAKADRDATAAALDEDPINDARIVPVPRGNERMQQIFGVTNPGEGGNYIDLDSKEDLTGNTYTGGVVKIIDGKPLLETNDAPAAPATKESGNKVKVNLFKQKAGWKWIDYDGPETIVSTHQGSKHHYSLSSDFETPVTLQTYPKQPSEPRLRPTSQGKVVLGNKIGSISVRGKVHPVYDQVTIVDKRDQEDPVVDSSGPALTSVSSPNVIDIMDGVEDVPKLKGKTEVATFLQERALEKLGGQPRDLASEADRDAIADDMVAEAVHEMENQDDAMEWYDSTIAKTLSMMSMKHPELDTDPDAKTAFLISLAITSQNLAVPENLQYGEEVYQHFSQNGRFLEKKFGSKGGAVKLNLEKANMLLDRLGSMEALRDFLETKFTVRELDQVLKQHLDTDSKQVSGENVDTEVYGAQVFGPKIGNGFYTNLRGDFSPVTIDMWFMRTVGRLQGKVLSFDENRVNNQLQRLKTALGRKRMSKDALIAKAQQLKSKHESDFKKFRSEYDSGKRKKSDATKAAEQIVISLKGTRDVPANGTERNQLRDIVNRAVVKFKDQTGIDIPPASFQALIWYPEQDLYKSLGVNLKSTRQDYASSTKRFLIQEGYNEEDLNRAADRVRLRSEQGAGSAQPGTSQANQETVGAAGGRTGRPLQEEKGPVLATEDPVDNSVEAAFARVQRDYLEPTPAEIKEKLPEAEDLVQFTIGKKGSSYEEGITSEADIRRIADLLDISISLVDKKGAVKDVISRDSRGNYQNKGRGTRGSINVRSPDIIGKPQYLVTLLHEVGHGLESQTLDGEEAAYNVGPSPHPKGSKSFNADHYRHGTFREHMYHTLRIAKGEDIYAEYEPDVSHLTLPDYDEAKEIRKEIDDIQKDTSVRFPGFAPGSVDTEGLKVRPSMDALIRKESRREAELLVGTEDFDAFQEQRKKSAERMQKEYGNPYNRYIKKTAEFSVDALLLYLQDPQMMKLVAPTTSKYIQKVYNKANMPVKFYSSPLVAVLAILLAGLAKGMGGEEEEQQPGALSMQPGLLTT